MITANYLISKDKDYVNKFIESLYEQNDKTLIHLIRCSLSKVTIYLNVAQNFKYTHVDIAVCLMTSVVKYQYFLNYFN